MAAPFPVDLNQSQLYQFFHCPLSDVPRHSRYLGRQYDLITTAVSLKRFEQKCAGEIVRINAPRPPKRLMP